MYFDHIHTFLQELLLDPPLPLPGFMAFSFIPYIIIQFVLPMLGNHPKVSILRTTWLCPRSHQLSTAPQLGVGRLLNPSTLKCELAWFYGLTQASTTVVSWSWVQWPCCVQTPWSFPTSGSYGLSTPLSLMAPETWGGCVMLMSHLMNTAHSLVLCILMCCERLW